MCCSTWADSVVVVDRLHLHIRSSSSSQSQDNTAFSHVRGHHGTPSSLGMPTVTTLPRAPRYRLEGLAPVAQVRASNAPCSGTRRVWASEGVGRGELRQVDQDQSARRRSRISRIEASLWICACVFSVPGGLIHSSSRYSICRHPFLESAIFRHPCLSPALVEGCRCRKRGLYRWGSRPCRVRRCARMEGRRMRREGSGMWANEKMKGMCAR